MRSIVVDWTEAPRKDRGIRIAHDDPDGWNLRSYADLARASHGAAAQLLDRGLRRGGVAAIVRAPGAGLVETMAGAWLAGGTVSNLPPLQAFQDADAYVRQSARLLRATQPAVVVTDEPMIDLLRRSMAAAGVRGEPVVLAPEPAAAAARRPPADPALLQFTSGSSGRPQGVPISHANLDSNVRMIARWLGMTPEEGLATWLPAFHDMGLVGCLLAPIALQMNLWILRPEQFVRAPRRWLECFDRGKATITAAPSFGFGFAARRVSPAQLEGLDLSGWKAAVVGAEPVDVRALEAFARVASAARFSRSTFCPAYGLGEATLAVTGQPVGEVPAAVRVDPRALRLGEPVELLDGCPLGDPRAGVGDGWVVGCGGPLRGLQVGVVDRDGKPLSEGRLGEVSVRGPSVAAGYHRNARGGSTRFEDGVLRTGDAGFLLDGQLYVLGRMGDSLKIRGRSVFAEELESRAAGVARLAPGKLVVVTGIQEGVPGVAVVAATEPGEWGARVASFLRGELGSGVPIRIYAGERRVIRRTSSGKPRRRAMWDEIQRGELEARLILEVDP